MSTLTDTLHLAPGLMPNMMEKTWVIMETDLWDIESLLHQWARDNEDALSKIPLFGSVRDGLFLYRAVINATTTIDHSTTAIAAPSTRNAPKPCNICHRQVLGPDRQNHMGRHILYKLRGVIETSENLGTVSMQYPCGFCGQSSINGACQLCIDQFSIEDTEAETLYQCPHYCKFCHDVHWKYNMRHHLQEWHPSWDVESES